MRGVAGLLALAACTGEVDIGGPDAGEQPEGPSVGDLVESVCSTSAVLGLSLQIADEIGCMDPEALVPFADTEQLRFAGAAVLPYISSAALVDLELALADNSGLEMQVTSGFRTVAQQYLLYRWSLSGRCDIAIAAEPGSSNHESGRALDIGNYGTWSAALPVYRWEQTVPGDAVHFDHLDSPDNRGLDVLAFQRLWNVNVPGDPIAEDGLYGPDTESRLVLAPADGFAIGAGCSSLLSETIEPIGTAGAERACAH